MLRRVQTPRYEAFLAGYRVPAQRFEDSRRLPSSLRPVWTALQADAFAVARKNAIDALDQHALLDASEKAGLYIGQAAAELALGATDEAFRLSGKALELAPRQWSAHRIRLAILGTRRDYAAAFEYLSELDVPATTPVWDEPLSAVDVALALASWSWLLGNWDDVAAQLQQAYPGGLTDMPAEVQEDWFRLSLYRGLPEEAAAAAALLIPERPVERKDEILQTFVQSGWTAQALPLYRTAYESEPGNQLLRRRLVALCIKEGQIEEARKLTAPGALRTAA